MTSARRGLAPVVLWLPVLLLAGCAGCGEKAPPAAADVSVMVSPAEAETPVGGSVRFEVKLSGRVPSMAELDAVVWRSSNLAVAVVDTGGVAVAQGVGQASITATFRGASASATLTVLPPFDAGPPDVGPPVDAGGEVDPGPPPPLSLLVISEGTGFHRAMAPGSRQRFRALARLADGSFADVTDDVTWSSSDEVVLAPAAAGQAPGEARAVAPGTANLQATLAGRTAALAVDVMTPEGLELSSPRLRLPAGSTETLEARLRFSDRRVQQIAAAAAWQSSAAAVVSAAGAGTLVAVGPGVALASARFGELSASAEVTVTEATVASLSLSLTSARLAAGTSHPVTVEATYTDGSRRDVTAEARFVSSKPDLATVRGGRLAALAPGDASLSALVPGAPATATASASVTVTDASVTELALELARASVPVGAELAPRAIALFSDGSHQDVTEDVLWQSDAPELGMLSTDGRGRRRLRVLSEGTIALRASLGGVIARGELFVGGPMLVSLDVEPALSTLAPGTLTRLAAIAVFSDGVVVDVTENAAWSSGGAAALGVSSRPESAGLVRAVGGGIHPVTATFGGQRAEASIQVIEGTLAGIEVQPSNPDLPLGTELPVRAIGRFTDGSTLVLGEEVRWSSDDTAIAPITGAGGSRGVISALRAGTATVTARVGSLSAETAVSVVDVTLETLSLLPGPPRLARGTRGTLLAQARFSDGSTREVSDAVFWSSSSPNVLTVWSGPLASGVSAVAPGTSTVTARFWMPLAARSGSTTAQVTDATLVGITIEPMSLSLATGETRRLMAVGQLSDGSTQALPAAVWASGDRQRAAVANRPGSAGSVTGLAPGPVVITASRAGKSATTTITVTAPVLTRIVVTPASPTLRVGSSTMLTAHAYYSDGSRRDVTQQARWESAISGVAAVSDEPGSRGNVVGVGTGIVKVTARYEESVGYVFVTVVE